MAVPKKAAPKKKVVKKKSPAKKRIGRPQKITLAIFEKIALELETSIDGLDKIAKRLNTSATAFYRMADADKTGKLTERYRRARENQSHYFNDKITEVAFDDVDDEKPFVGANHIQRDKLKIEALRLASLRANPKKYGDKLDVTETKDITVTFK
jgi:hypothetical protein